MTVDRTVALADRYELRDGTVLLNGVQALVRLPLEQRRADRRRGNRTAGLISGYEGSPLGGYDLELGRSRKLLDEHDIVHQPAVNEELAATALMGSQQAHLQPSALFEGVFGLWYGKAPGLDRASDALRHANLMGVDRRSGALVCVGDDARAKSSTVPSSSELALMDLMIPVLLPADPQEVLAFGLHGIAMSRCSGLYSGLKIATNVADGTSSVSISEQLVVPVEPDTEIDGRPFRHRVSARMLGAPLLELEESMVGPRLEIARRYIVANRLNRIASRGPQDTVGIVAGGKAWRDLIEALSILGVRDRLESLGIRLLKIGAPFPLDVEQVREFAGGLREVVVVEEKRAFLELLVKEALYGALDRPIVVGKSDDRGAPLLRASADLDPGLIAAALRRRLSEHMDLDLEPTPPASTVNVTPASRALPLAPSPVTRTPYFCSGCPHNSSTKVPSGTLVGGGIGCHGLALLMPEERVGMLTGLCQMGGEGATWIGMSPFVSANHLVQNVGDGTFHHSGSLAVRAAVASGVNLTFKLLVNSAVAMTGGQAIVGGRTVPELCRLLESEGVARVIVTTEDVGRYRGVKLTGNVEVWDRSRLIEAQEELAKVAGVTVLLHDQECATELRRKRKRGRAETPSQRVFINERACEGCGDCGAKSNCLSVQPVETSFGRKTRIHQASCNVDVSCLEGDCPSFLTVTPSKRAATPTEATRTEAARIGDGIVLPDPAVRRPGQAVTVRLAGVGGTGIVTTAQVLAMAAHVDGLHVAGLDQVGLAQKGGAVISDLKFGPEPIEGANKLDEGCDAYLVCDLVAGTAAENLAPMRRESTVAVISTSVAPTAEQVIAVDAASSPVDELATRIEQRCTSSMRLRAQDIATALLGTDQVANTLVVGAAFQRGVLPLSLAALEEAIALNGTAVDLNLEALRLGRLAVVSPETVDRALEGSRPVREAPPVGASVQAIIDAVGAEAGSELGEIVVERVPDLVAYQSRRYAQAYADLVRDAQRVELERTGVQDGPLSRAVARYAYKLMAYKDEYEIARLSIDPALTAAVEQEFGPGARYAYKLHPPLLRALGLKRKLTLGRWFRPAFHVLYRLRRLRGTAFDPFGRAEVRRVERALVSEYRSQIEQVLEVLSPANHEAATSLAELPDLVRGYEELKLANVARYRERMAAAWNQLRSGPSPTARPG
nr:indolepyruvate ferredoxin oxidoreductase family protein [Patulibacter medicamentivorans]